MSIGEREERAGPGTGVMVEVGDGNGALLLYVDESLRNREVEISRAGATRRVHTGVLERETGDGRVLAAVFGSIPAGEYVVWRDQHTAAGTVIVRDGQVSRVRLGDGAVSL